MKLEVYESLSAKERIIYDELAAFAKRLAERQEEMIELLKTILVEANH